MSVVLWNSAGKAGVEMKSMCHISVINIPRGVGTEEARLGIGLHVTDSE